MSPEERAPRPVTLREATARDFSAVLALNDAFVRFLSPLTPESLARLHEECALHLVVERDGEIGAFLLAFREGAAYDSVNYRWFDERYERFLYVDRVVVGESLRGRGVGGTLYGHLFDVARRSGVPRVACEFDLDPPNPRSARFHARFGFREVGRQAVAAGEKQVTLQVADVEPAASARGGSDDEGSGEVAE